MSVRDRIRYLIAFPRSMRRYLRVLDAWGEEDWLSMLHLLDAERELDTDSDKILRGLALAKTRQFEAAAQEFGRVRRSGVWGREKPIYYLEYANALRRTGRRAEARGLLIEAPLKKFPEEARRWAEQYLAAEATRQDRRPYPFPAIDGEWTHWWIEGDGFLLAVVAADELTVAHSVVRENRDRMNRIVAYRAKSDSSGSGYIHDEDGAVVSSWNPWTGKP